MASAKRKITLSPSRDIPFDRLVLSQSNVRRVKAGVSIGELADDIARRTLLQGLNVRPLLDEAGGDTGMFEIPAGGRRFRALELLVKQKRLAKDAPVPCIVQQAAANILAEEDSYAENAVREALHPLDQFRAMQAMVDKGAEVEAIAAHFMTTPAVVRQRLKLASVSPVLHDLYAEEEITLDQLMAFTVSDDHERQVQVWEMLAHSYNKSPSFIRQKLTENSVRAVDKRVRFVSVDAYLAAGGGIVRDLFEADDGGWLTDPALLDRLVDEKLSAVAAHIGKEGWLWVQTAIDLPWSATSGLRRLVSTEVAMTAEEEATLAALEAEADTLSDTWSEEPDVPAEVHARLEAIEAEIGALTDRPLIFDETEMIYGGAFVSVDYDGTVRIDRGFVRPEDEPVVETGDAADDGEDGPGGEAGAAPDAGPDGAIGSGAGGEEADEEGLKPLPERLVSDLTAWRTLALQDAFAQNPQAAFAAVLHALVLSVFYRTSHETCLELSVSTVYFTNEPAGLRECGPARAIDARHEDWRARLPKEDADLWEALLALDANEQASLFAHCASLGLNAQAEIVPKYGSGRVTSRSVERRIAHSHILARALNLDVLTAGWRPTADGYFRHVTKPRILADVTEARGEPFAKMIDHLRKPDMASEAEKLLEDSGWLPEPLRTPVDIDASDVDGRDAGEGDDGDLDAVEAGDDGAAAGDAGIEAAADPGGPIDGDLGDEDDDGLAIAAE
ncbi:ParB family chromosome partitioning protein [Sphingopyxis sp. OAS728]|uniref:ParB/RepB/Spo0J family partition protein n=1 Tax=Sphingopyxis sp. OAS728 TaxID=2663823 RepID=UPI00178A7D4A|nr:ParB/RepB/Spo0J family partition protein [Sphingopyxis sp. OAS728]MBE1527921.1 ParB family chromosome partitioning protein [Sphingopyxis sp. OAS728]